MTGKRGSEHLPYVLHTQISIDPGASCRFAALLSVGDSDRRHRKPTGLDCSPVAGRSPAVCCRLNSAALGSCLSGLSASPRQLVLRTVSGELVYSHVAPLLRRPAYVPGAVAVLPSPRLGPRWKQQQLYTELQVHDRPHLDAKSVREPASAAGAAPA